MKRYPLILLIILIASSAFADTNDTLTRRRIPLEMRYKKVNFGIRGGFNSTIFYASNFKCNGHKIDNIENNFKIGEFITAFLRINMGKWYIQPEITHSKNRSDIIFIIPNKKETQQKEQQQSSIQSNIQSVELPLLFGYNFIKHGPYGLSAYLGPNLRHLIMKKSKVELLLNGNPNYEEKLNKTNLNLSTGISLYISKLFFDVRYDIGLYNISSEVKYKDVIKKDNEINRVNFNRRDNVLSFSLGMFF